MNFAYDHGGRLLSENYAPCETHHPAYDATPEVTYEYDGQPADASAAFLASTATDFVPGQQCQSMNFTAGRLVAVTDRAQRSLTCYDARGRTVEVAKQLASPTGALSGNWYNRRARYDGADRPVEESTGATLLSTGQQSRILTTYTARGKVNQVNSSYGLLVDHVQRDADGLVKEIEYGDLAETTTAFSYDDLRRLRNLTTYRAAQPGWTGGETEQMLLQDEQFTYDRVGNPTEIRDWRDPEEWPAGAKPVTRRMQYDDLYRLERIDYDAGSSGDDWVDPYAAEVSDNTRPQPTPRTQFAAGERVKWQTYAYDWLGNTTATVDDLQAFYDRSLGTVTNNGYQLSTASQPSGSKSGSLSTTYDAAGNLLSMDVLRNGPCTVTDGCTSQHYTYEWDEVGRLVKATRDTSAELIYTYDASDQRVRKSSGSRHTLYVFASLELRGAAHDGTNYEVTAATEVPFLFANGVRLARVVSQDATTHVFLELGDHLGSTSVVLDRASGELVQRSTAYAYGEVESSLRASKWESFREDYRFTGKEDDVELGLIYFGKRFYAPLLQRWISPDPLAIHAPGQADLNLYAYVHGKVLVAVDPVGLADDVALPASKDPNNEAGLGGMDKPTPDPQVPRTDPEPAGLMTKAYTAFTEFFYGDGTRVPANKDLEDFQRANDQQVMAAGVNVASGTTEKGAAVAAGIPVAAGIGAIGIAYAPGAYAAGSRFLAGNAPRIASGLRLAPEFLAPEGVLVGGGAGATVHMADDAFDLGRGLWMMNGSNIAANNAEMSFDASLLNA